METDFLKLKEVSCWNAMDEIDKVIGMTDYQKSKLREYFLYNRFTFGFYRYRSYDKSANKLWRFTFPLFIVFYLILFVICTMKWLFTGTFGFINENPILVFYNKWYDKINCYK